MKIFTKTMQCLLSMVVVSIISAVWIMLLNDSNNEVTNNNIMAAVPIGLGLGWAIFQVFFVRWKKIKAEGGMRFWELIILSIQGTGIVLVSLFVLLWIKAI